MYIHALSIYYLDITLTNNAVINIFPTSRLNPCQFHPRQYQ